MQEDSSILLHRLSHLARGVLEAHFRPNLWGLAIDPSFGRTERLEVNKTSLGLQWTYMFWDEHTDWDLILANASEQQKLKFGKVKPSVQFVEGTLPDDYFRDEEARLKNLQLPISIPQRLEDGFLDGTHYTIALSGYPHGARLSWWEALPPQWAALEPIFKKLMANMKTARQAADHGAKSLKF